MAETMYEAPGVGLAATQVDIHEHIVVIDVSDEQNKLMVLLIRKLFGQAKKQNLGERVACLFPGFMTKLKDQQKSGLKH